MECAGALRSTARDASVTDLVSTATPGAIAHPSSTGTARSTAGAVAHSCTARGPTGAIARCGATTPGARLAGLPPGRSAQEG